jgi:hypothetical protein
MNWVQPALAISQGRQPHPLPSKHGVCWCLDCMRYRFLLKRMNDSFWDSMGASEESLAQKEIENHH